MVLFGKPNKVKALPNGTGDDILIGTSSPQEYFDASQRLTEQGGNSMPALFTTEALEHPGDEKPRNAPVMPQERIEDFDASDSGPLALLRLEIRYMRRDLYDLKVEFRENLNLKADKNELNKEKVQDHEERLRYLESKVLWFMGAGAALGAVGGALVHLIWH